MSAARLLLAKFSTFTKKLSLSSNSNAKATPCCASISVMSDGFKTLPGTKDSKAVLSVEFVVIEEPLTHRAWSKVILSCAGMAPASKSMKSEHPRRIRYPDSVVHLTNVKRRFNNSSGQGYERTKTHVRETGRPSDRQFTCTQIKTRCPSRDTSNGGETAPRHRKTTDETLNSAVIGFANVHRALPRQRGCSPCSTKARQRRSHGVLAWRPPRQRDKT